VGEKGYASERQGEYGLFHFNLQDSYLDNILRPNWLASISYTAQGTPLTAKVDQIPLRQGQLRTK
jgi:hypothetical protein